MLEVLLEILDSSPHSFHVENFAFEFSLQFIWFLKSVANIDKGRDRTFKTIFPMIYMYLLDHIWYRHYHHHWYCMQGQYSSNVPFKKSFDRKKHQLTCSTVYLVFNNINSKPHYHQSSVDLSSQWAQWFSNDSSMEK